ncbi:PQQ-binding-like beta-propeller repeat protein [Candidatus Fermentibacteria bacterium]|nr:PQQ-binding-like beta-propeller repeat protein [Candidatus Fermentibacteria bacterium]
MQSRLTVLLAMVLLGPPPALTDAYYPIRVHDVDLVGGDSLLVTDGGPLNMSGGAVVEMDRSGSILWSLDTGLSWPHNADIVTDSTIVISDTGNDRVIIVHRAGGVLWSSDDISLSDGSTLHYPNDANVLAGGHLLITDRDNHRVIEIDGGGTIVWQFGVTGVAGGGPNRLNGPHNADRLSGGNTIIADSNNNRIIEVTAGGAIVWTYAAGLDWPRDADRLANGHTIIVDSNHERILEVAPDGSVVWEHPTGGLTYDADRLEGQTTLYSVDASIREVDTAGAVIWEYPITYATTVVEGYFVIAPSGSALWTKIIQPNPALYPGELFPAVVNVPGGLGAGENGNLQVAASGFVEVHFNAEGRGVQHPSDGEEDHNGVAHQDDLEAVMEFVHGLPNVRDDNVGVVTSSYGITMGAGCLGRYPELQVAYLIDVEGPSDNFVTSMEPWSLDEDPSNDRYLQAYDLFGHWSLVRDPSPENAAWWAEREAASFIAGLRCRYLRLQAQWDHAQPPNAQWPGFDYNPVWYPCKHAIDLTNIAILGGVPWTRVNVAAIGNEPNVLYDHDNPPIYYAQSMQSHPGELRRAILEIASMPPLHCIDFDWELPVP